MALFGEALLIVPQWESINDHLGDTGGAATAPAHPVRPAWCEARTGPNSRDVVEGLVLDSPVSDGRGSGGI